eukprot:9907727-Ditylum_brightwellii.AAC.1
MQPKLKVNGTFKNKTGALFDSDVPYNFMNMAQRARASEAHLKYDTCTKERIQSIHEAGMDFMAWSQGPRDMKKDFDTTYFDVGNEDLNMHCVVVVS